MIELSEVSAGYGKKVVVRGTDIRIQRGEILSLIGPNGGGKSTLLKSINGQLALLGGSILIEDKDIKGIPLKELSKKMSIVTTRRITPQLMTCADVVLSGRLPYADGLGLLKETDRACAAEAMKTMRIEEYADIPYENLSDGQKQRALIARAICQKPEVLVMDEPTSYMDIRHRLELMDVVRELAASGVTVIMSLHELELALAVSGRVLLLYRDSRIRCETPEHVLKEGLLKELFDLDDEMYAKAVRGLSFEKESAGQSEKSRRSSFFTNSSCEYFPCHDLPPERFNCMFCYCPLYGMADCGGTYRINEKGIKDCTDCTFVHERTNYPLIIRKLKENMYHA